MWILSILHVSVTATSREKRLVLHSNTDIATEVVKMKSEIASLTANIACMNASHASKMATVTEAVKFINSSHKAEIASLNASFNVESAKQNKSFIEEISKLNGDINTLKDTLTKVTINDHGSTYTRWGRTVCPGNGTQLVYKGYMAGKTYEMDGSGANHLCLPEDPTWGKFDDANQASNRGYIYGSEFQEDGNVIFGKHVYNQDVPCAVCKAPGVSVMIPARTNCYLDWNLEYTGYIMSEVRARKSPSEYVCIDADPEFLYRGESRTLGNTLYLVEGRCGTLPCPPYVSYRELACSVCSK